MTPTETLARTIFGEASSDGIPGMCAVASVVLNRVASGVRWWGHDIESVCLAHEQFDCWMPGNDYDRMMAATPDTPGYQDALEIAAQAVAGTLPDNTNGATTYKTTALPWPNAWGEPVDPVAVVGQQSFYILPV